MTGHGEAHRHHAGAAVTVEVRSVNNRYFKLTLRASDGFHALEPHIDAAVRRQVRRGSLQVALRIDREPTSDDYRLNEAVLLGYLRQLEPLRRAGSIPPDPVRVEQLLGLPGVVQEKAADWDAAEAQWPLVEPVLHDALQHLAQMRAEEGRAMGVDLAANCRQIADQLSLVERRAPLVVESYRARLSDRLNKLLQECGASLQPQDVLREVGMFAERCDIAEEIVRLKSHLEQFSQVIEKEDCPGRKLEFLIQEMFRETNTIGSKANDAEIARGVIEIKSAIERIKEMIQNVE